MRKIQTYNIYAGVMAVAACAVVTFQFNAFGADAQKDEKKTESELIAILQSDAQPGEKAITCKKLVLCGTKAAVPALAALLTDEKLAAWARIGLEGIPDPAVDDALRNAMGKLKGRLLVGVINSISRRGDTKAVSALIQKAKDADVEVASAAVDALGCIGSDEAVTTLEQMLAGTNPAMLPAVSEACLKCANSMIASGKERKAEKLCESLYKMQVPRYVRMEAMRNLIMAKGNSGIPLLIEQLNSNDSGMVSVAMGLAHTMPGKKLTKKLMSEVGKLPPEKQVYVIDALGCRLDKSVVPTLLGLAKSPAASVCIAAIDALAKIGDASALPLLVEIAVSGESDAAKAAQSGLVAFRSAEADAACASLLAAKNPASRVVGADVLNSRASTGAMPVVMKAAMEDADENVRIACINVLRELGKLEVLPTLVDILVKNRSASEVQTVEKAMATICGRQPDVSVCSDSLIGGLSKAQPEQKCALLRILRSIGDAKSLQAVRSAVQDSNAEVKDVATRLICDWSTVDAAQDMLDLAKNSGNNTYKLLGLRGYIRVSGGKDVAGDRRLAMCKEASGLIKRDDERKILLGVLGGADDIESFQMAAACLDNAATKDEACLAVVAIAEKLPKNKSADVVSALDRVLKISQHGDLAKRAGAVMKKMK